MSGPPRVGDVSSEHRPVCVYSPEPDDPACGRPAVRHIAVHGPEGRLHGLVVCEHHIVIARATAPVWGEHTFDPGLCSMPGTLWALDGRRCVVDTPSGQEPA